MQEAPGRSERPQTLEEAFILRCGLVGRWNQALLGLRRRRQSQFGAHRLGRAIIAIEPGAIVADAVAALRSGLHVVARAGLGHAQWQCCEKEGEKNTTRFHSHPPEYSTTNGR